MLGQGRYRVERVFADSGGMGLLYEARDTRCADNRVLIKTTRYDGGRHAREFRYTAAEATKHIEATRKILEWEKKVLVRFRNEGFNNIPSANDFFFDKTQTLQPSYEGTNGAFRLESALLASEPYLVMETIQGDVLERRMMDAAWRSRLEQHLLTMSRELLTVFIKMHKSFEVQGKPACFLYQDLKPANILVHGDDYFTLIDFGGTTLKLGEKTTEPTAGCITTGYAAPEAKGREAYIDQRFDLYTLGATLWHAVTRRDPRELGAEFPRLDPDAMRGQGVSDAFIALVGRALHPDPERRYPTAAAMRKDVMDMLRERVGG
jgi:serine/threonine protein kinase